MLKNEILINPLTEDDELSRRRKMKKYLKFRELTRYPRLTVNKLK